MLWRGRWDSVITTGTMIRWVSVLQWVPQSSRDVPEKNESLTGMCQLSFFMTPPCDWPCCVSGAVRWRGFTAGKRSEGLARVLYGPADIYWEKRHTRKKDHLQRLPPFRKYRIKFCCMLTSAGVSQHLQTSDFRSYFSKLFLEWQLTITHSHHTVTFVKLWL